jgi:hypothetical protein
LERTRLCRAVAFANELPLKAQHQTGLPLHGSSFHRQSLPERANANPSIVVGPSMPASFTSMDSESEISAEGNRKMIHNGRKPL